MRDAIRGFVERTFSILHARALSHATEDLDKVTAAMKNVLEGADMVVVRTEGHHGNPIAVLECTIESAREIDGFLRKLPDEAIAVLMDTVDKRVDDGCNLFLKLDKQEAYAGRTRLGTGDDVISIRLKVRAFPAKAEVAKEAARRLFRDILASRSGRAR